MGLRAVRSETSVGRAQLSRAAGEPAELLTPSFWGWRGGSAVKSIYCSFRGPMFSPQHPYNSLEPPITLTPGPGTLF